MPRLRQAGAYVLLLHKRRGTPAPAFTADPSLTGDAIVGSTLTVSIGTASNADSYAGSLRHVSDDTEVDTFTADGTYVIQDTDFGEALYLHVTATGAGGVATAESAATGRVAETPVQATGAELLANPLFTNWTGDNPDGWTVTGESGADPMVTQVAAGGGAGTGAARFYSSATVFQPRLLQSVLAIGSYYELYALMSARTSGAFDISDNGSASFVSYAATGRLLHRATDAIVRFRGSSVVPLDFTLDSASVKLITPNTQLAAPSADMRLDFFYTLPGSPVIGDCVWLLPRISDFASGNYWLGWLRYTGSAWDINGYTVASHTRTSRISATNIGATDGMRFNMNGDQVSLHTRASGVWTQRGSTVTNSTYQSATGANVLYTSSITPANLVYAPAA